MSPRDLVYVGHMLDTANKAISKTQSLSRAYDADENLRLALTHLIQIIGEAGRQVSREFSDRHPEIPWADIVGMRHKVVQQSGSPGEQKEAMTPKNVAISPELFARITEEAAAEGTTADQIANEATKRYLALRRLDRLQRYGQKRAEELGITEDDVPRLIAESRAERRR